MIELAKKELSALWGFVSKNRNEIRIISLATLFLILARYHRFEPNWLNYLFYYLSLPVLSIVFILRKNPLDYGLRLGNVKLWAFHAAIACMVSLVLVVLSTRFSSFGEFYTDKEMGFWHLLATRSALLLSLEFFYRGFLLFGLKKKFGGGAVIVQMIPYAILHIGKPEIEAVGCIVSGIYFGYVVYRTNSIWPAFLIHLFVNVANAVVREI